MSLPSHSLNLLPGYLDEDSISITEDSEGNLYCHLKQVTLYESEIFRHAMLELMNPVENPRYLIAPSFFSAYFRGENYLAVPTVCGQNKTQAESFFEIWRKYAGFGNLINTRNPEGRRILMKARTKNLFVLREKKSTLETRWM